MNVVCIALIFSYPGVSNMTPFDIALQFAGGSRQRRKRRGGPEGTGQREMPGARMCPGPKHWQLTHSIPYFQAGGRCHFSSKASPNPVILIICGFFPPLFVPWFVECELCGLYPPPPSTPTTIAPAAHRPSSPPSSPGPHRTRRRSPPARLGRSMKCHRSSARRIPASQPIAANDHRFQHPGYQSILIHRYCLLI